MGLIQVIVLQPKDLWWPEGRSGAGGDKVAFRVRSNLLWWFKMLSDLLCFCVIYFHKK